MNFKEIYSSIKIQWFSNVRADILSGITVSLALIPEALCFAIIAGVDPMVSLYGAFIIAVSISFFGGRSAMISSTTGSMSLLMGTLVAKQGVEYLFAATILTGIIQFLMGKLKFGRYMTFIPHPVMLGFVNALGILIFMAQLQRFKGESWPMYLMVAGSFILILVLPRFIKVIPPALITIILMTVIAVVTGMDVGTVGDAGRISSSLPFFHLPVVDVSLETLLIILPYSFSLALVGMLESLLTQSVLDELTESKSDKNRELKGQGLANVLAGIFGGMAGCALIGQSILNIKSGGRGRLSTLVSGTFLLVLIMILDDYVKKIPMAVLVGVMFIVVIETMDLKSLRSINKMPRADVVIMVITMMIMIVTHDLSKGVLVGVVISAVAFGWKMSSIRTKEHLLDYDHDKYKIYRIHGHMYFGTTTYFADLFDYDNDPEQVIIDFKNSHLWDYSSINALIKVREKYSKANKTVSLTGLNAESQKLLYQTGLQFY